MRGPAIVLSAKTDLLHATLEARRERGETLIYDPTEVSCLPSNGWSPLARATDWHGAVRAANAMSKVSGTTSDLGGSSNHWERVAAQLLALMLLAVRTVDSTWATSCVVDAVLRDRDTHGGRRLGVIRHDA